MIDCIHSINGICKVFSDSTVLQPCIEGPCNDYKERLNLTHIEKEKICACIQYQINVFETKINKLNGLKRTLTTNEFDEFVNAIEAQKFYKSLIEKIKSI